MRLAATAWAGLVGALLFMSGCQSGAQSDLVARELRMQEDKIYEQQDFLAQYQQLICKYRAENNTLKRMLADQAAPAAPLRRTTPSGEPASAGGRPTPSEAPPAPTAPATRPNEPIDLQIPPLTPTPRETPRINEQSASPRDDNAAPSPVVGESVQLASHLAPATPIARDVVWPIQPAGENRYELRAALRTGDAAPTVASVAEVGEAPKPDRVWLTGEVVPNESGGPRLAVDVTPLSGAGKAAPFAGELSLMILAPTSAGAPKNIARWDFPAGEVAAATGQTSGNPHTMQFHLELPAETPLDRPVELWVRLKANDGQKLLASVPIDFQRTTTFASVPFRTAASDQPQTPLVVRLVDGARGPNHPQSVNVPTSGEGWTIARPGKPGLAEKTAPPDGAWRASTQPMPTAIAVASPVQPALALLPVPVKPQPAEQAAPPPAAANPIPDRPPPIADPWSPNRGEAASPGLTTRTSKGGPTTKSAPNSAPLPAISTWSPNR
jgi:hypothetical protein